MTPDLLINELKVFLDRDRLSREIKSLFRRKVIRSFHDWYRSGRWDYVDETLRRMEQEIERLYEIDPSLALIFLTSTYKVKGDLNHRTHFYDRLERHIPSSIKEPDVSILNGLR